MTSDQARAQIKRFVGNNEKLDFEFEFVGDEWIAVCTQIPALSTGGKGRDDQEIRAQIKDAIVAAAGVDAEYADEAIDDVSLRSCMTMTV